VAKLSRKEWLDILARHAITEAKAGHMAPLIGRVRGVPDDYLSPDEREFLRKLLEENDGPRGKAEFKRLEITLARLLEGDIKTKKELIGKLKDVRERGWGRSSYYRKMKPKKPK
jgi:hypothetical protein